MAGLGGAEWTGSSTNDQLPSSSGGDEASPNDETCGAAFVNEIK